MSEIITFIYWYCTDFCVNLANLLGVSYVEVNMVLFLLLFPALILVLVVLNIYRYFLKLTHKTNISAKS